jgi:chromate reductase
MSKYQIAVLVGSLRQDSLNRKLASGLVKLAPVEFSFKQVQISDLPLYNQDDDANPAESVKRLKNEIKNGASPGAMGTALAQQHLRNILAHLDMPTLGQPEAFIHAKEGLFDEAGNIGADNKKFMQNWMDKYVAFVRSHN